MEIFTAGESHGSSIVLLINGFPAEVKIDKAFIENELKERRKGAGRSQRMEIESDSIEIESGVIDRKTTGAPICVRILNSSGSQLFDKRVNKSLYPRPGHADFAASEKYGYESMLIAAERASARETSALVCAGGFLKQFLANFEVKVCSEIIEIGGIPFNQIDFDEMKKSALEKGTFGGAVKITIKNSLPGIGSSVIWNQKLDSMIAARILSVQSVKGIYFGNPEIHKKQGLDSLDLFNLDFTRKTNNSGGIESGITTGEDIVFYVYFKPIPTQPFPIPSINYETGESGFSPVVRSDLWAVEAGAKVCEAVSLIPYCELFLKKFGADTLKEIKKSFYFYKKRLKWKKNG